MTDTVFLYIATLVITAILVLVLVIYLVLIIIALRRSGTHLEQLAAGLQKVAEDTQPLKERLITINTALSQLQSGFSSVDHHLIRIGNVLKLT